MHSRSLILTFFLSVFLTPGLVAQEKGGLVHRLLEKISSEICSQRCASCVNRTR